MPAPVLRGVALAAVAAVGVSGAAVAVTGTTTPPSPETERALREAVVPAPALVAAGRSVLTIPAPPVAARGASPGTLGVPAPDPAVLDPAGLSRAVARAQADARRAAEAGGHAAPAEQADDRAERTDAHGDEQTAAQTDARADARAQAQAEARAADEADDRDAEERRTAERGRRAGRAADPGHTTDGAGCALDTGELGAVKPHVRAAAEFLGCAFGEPEVLGVAGRSGASDHPRGRALDFMVDRATGDRLAACAIRDREALGVSYVIWRQRIDTGSGFRAMPDRGSPTANHFDHVHVSFRPGAGTGDLAGC